MIRISAQIFSPFIISWSDLQHDLRFTSIWLPPTPCPRSIKTSQPPNSLGKNATRGNQDSVESYKCFPSILNFIGNSDTLEKYIIYEAFSEAEQARLV